MKKERHLQASLTALFSRHREIGLLLILIVLWGVVGLRNPLFLSGDKILFILKDTAPLFVLAAGIALAGFFVCLRIRVPRQPDPAVPAETGAAPSV